MNQIFIHFLLFSTSENLPLYWYVVFMWFHHVSCSMGHIQYNIIAVTTWLYTMVILQWIFLEMETRNPIIQCHKNCHILSLWSMLSWKFHYCILHCPPMLNVDEKINPFSHACSRSHNYYYYVQSLWTEYDDNCTRSVIVISHSIL